MCKKLICLVIFMLASGIAQGAEWDRAAYWDARCYTNWADATSAANVRDALDTAGYTILNADELKTWMDGHIADGELSVVVFAMDVPPETVAETMSATCTLRQYLDAGGKIVAYADIPFYNVAHLDGTWTTWGDAGATNILGFPAASAPRDQGMTAEFTTTGIDWGLTATWVSQRPAAAAVVASENLTVLATDGNGHAPAWVKHYVPGDRYRGFVYTRDTTGMPNVDDLIRLAEYFPMTAGRPDPADGSSVAPEYYLPNVYMILDYTPGEGAITHTAYFSDVEQNVIDRNPAFSLGSVPPWPSPTAFVVGYDDPGIPEYARAPLVGGTTYYWCIDEFDGTDTWPGKVWRFTVIPEEAWGPDPYDGEVVLTDVTMTWNLGDIDPAGKTLVYDVYLGTDETAVADANIYDDPSVPEYMGEVAVASYDAIGLDPATQYFWRVDQVLKITRPPFTRTVTPGPGPVWSFTTLPEVPITDPDLAAYYKLDGEVPGWVFDYSGYANHGTLQNNPQYVAGYEDGGLDFDGGNDYVDFGVAPAFPTGTSARSMCAWAKTDSVAGGWAWIAAYGAPGTSQAMFIGRNAADLFGGGYGDDVRFNGFWQVDAWRHICLTYDGTTARLYADGSELTSEPKTWNLVLSRAHLGRQVNDAAEFWDGVLDEVRIYSKALSLKEIKILAGFLNASDPDPPNGAIDVTRTPTFNWTPGAFAAAANGSVVYYSQDLSAVTNRTAPSATLSTSSFTLPITLDLGASFYWAVDTVNGVETWPGDVWTFTTVDWLPVDDMESYVIWSNPAGPHIFVAWRDGFGNCTPGNGNDTGAVLTENASPVLGGIQSMKYDFDNDGIVYSPCTMGNVTGRIKYSRIEAQTATLVSGIGSDWTVEGVKALSINFHGQTGNATTESLWVQLQDGAKGYGEKVFYGTYEGESLDDFDEPAWREWNIDLADFDVDLTNVVSIVIGIGDEAKDTAYGSGTLYLDDIRLYAPKCVPSRSSPAFAKVDYSGPAGVPDCLVDYHELRVMCLDWLVGGDFTASPLLARWELNGNYDDSSGNGNTGSPSGTGLVFVTDPVRGQVLSIPGTVGDYVLIDRGPGGVGITGTQPRTIAGWARADTTTITDWTNIFGFTGMSGNGGHFDIEIVGDTDSTTAGYIGLHMYGDEYDILPNDMAWHHFAATWDGTDLRVYGDAVLINTVVPGVTLVNPGYFHMGKRMDNANYFPGSVDDVCVFDRALTGPEIVTVMGGGAGTFAPEYHPVPSPANILDPEAEGNRKVNFSDYAELVDNWLATELWPH